MLVTVFGFISQAYSASFIEPDRKIKQLFGWSIHGGRYSQGCVAVFAYSKDKSGFDRELWLGGEKTNTFTLRMNLDPDELAGSDMIEIGRAHV